jgi:hypothetical protein
MTILGDYMILTREEFTKQVIEGATQILEAEAWFRDVCDLGIDMSYDDGVSVKEAIDEVVDETRFIDGPDEYEFIA